MTPDIATGDPMVMLCLHCARRIVSPRSISKYNALENHLKFRAAFTDQVTLKFARIDGLIGDNLPMAAYRDSLWWSNASSSEHAKAWLDAGWEVQEVNFKAGWVIQKSKNFPKTTQEKSLKSPTLHTRASTPASLLQSTLKHQSIQTLRPDQKHGTPKEYAETNSGLKEKTPKQKPLDKK
jgi:hypothetical protein